MWRSVISSRRTQRVCLDPRCANHSCFDDCSHAWSSHALGSRASHGGTEAYQCPVTVPTLFRQVTHLERIIVRLDEFGTNGLRISGAEATALRQTPGRDIAPFKATPASLLLLKPVSAAPR
jgi:hypothetical protein